MQSSSVIAFLVLALCLQQHYVQANWFTDLFTKSKAEEAHNTVYNNDSPQKHKASWTHELIAAAAGFEAMRAYERHQAKQNGQPVNHSMMKGVLAGLAAAAVDHLIETKGLDWIDAQKARGRATKQAEKVASEHYGLEYTNDDEDTGNNRSGQRTGQRSENSRTGNSGGDRSWQNGVREADREAVGNSRRVAAPATDEYR